MPRMVTSEDESDVGRPPPPKTSKKPPKKNSNNVQVEPQKTRGASGRTLSAKQQAISKCSYHILYVFC
jgi:hypothetical protein